jgi:hypothetical protein
MSGFRSTGFILVLLAMLLLAGGFTLALAQGNDQEDNNTCATAQWVGDISFPFTINGELLSTSDVDFYRFNGTPGDMLTVDLEGNVTAPVTLHDPMLGMFDSNCNRVAWSDDSGADVNALLQFPVPDDGVYILAASSYGDYDFNGSGLDQGTYILEVDRLQPIGAIRGRVVDAYSGAPLTGSAFPNVFVELYLCGEENRCNNIHGVHTDSDGFFEFTVYPGQEPLMEGVYSIQVHAEQYQLGQTAEFLVEAGEVKDFEDFTLTPFDVQFGGAQPCSVPSEGGLCAYSVTVTNRLDTRLEGAAWIIVDGGRDGNIQHTVFQPEKPRKIFLSPGESRQMELDIRLPEWVPDGVMFCVTAFYGREHKFPQFSPIGESELFCFSKGGSIIPADLQPEGEQIVGGKDKGITGKK